MATALMKLSGLKLTGLTAGGTPNSRHGKSLLFAISEDKTLYSAQDFDFTPLYTRGHRPIKCDSVHIAGSTLYVARKNKGITAMYDIGYGVSKMSSRAIKPITPMLPGKNIVRLERGYAPMVQTYEDGTIAIYRNRRVDKREILYAFEEEFESSLTRCLPLKSDLIVFKPGDLKNKEGVPVSSIRPTLNGEDYLVTFKDSAEVKTVRRFKKSEHLSLDSNIKQVYLKAKSVIIVTQNKTYLWETDGNLSNATEIFQGLDIALIDQSSESILGVTNNGDVHRFDDTMGTTKELTLPVPAKDITGFATVLNSGRQAYCQDNTYVSAITLKNGETIVFYRTPVGYIPPEDFHYHQSSQASKRKVLHNSETLKSKMSGLFGTKR